ncbi:Uncharacterised protein [Mycobacteroides abscessus subsp. abscessus]|uniref:DUF7572 family protein n=1 Tax=Mycobacteroides abscessus TaxID=36809 RepID=UPI0009287BC7|nr:hypothetical protein [Mycobacteroides abscessus]SIL71657.1 Uncharacterised protein [Mycobacteroides abscessus subsp. abscessus]
MHTAELVSEFLPQFGPITNHYRCSDGQQTWYLLITVPSTECLRLIEGLGIPFDLAHLPTHVDVFLADENAVVLDADMNAATGLTALCRIDDCASHDQALAAMGYDKVIGGSNG